MYDSSSPNAVYFIVQSKWFWIVWVASLLIVVVIHLIYENKKEKKIKK